MSYEAPIEELVSRLSGRCACPTCKAVYHDVEWPPRAAGVCDGCGSRLIRRDDDRPESIRVRMQAYQETARPVADYYEQSGNLFPSWPRCAEEVLERSLLALNGVLCRRRVDA